MAANRTIAHVVNSLNPGGAERLVVDMALQLAERDSVTVICLDQPGEWACRLRRRGIPVICLWRQDGFDLSVPVKLSRILRRARIDLVHAHQTTPWIYCAMARLLFSHPKLLFEEHGRFYPETRKPRRVFVNRHVTRRLTHRTVAVSEDIRNRLVDYEGLSSEQIDVIHNGVRAPDQISRAEKEQLRREFGFEPGDFVVGSIGRLDSIKNFPMFIEALRLAQSGVANADARAIRGLIVGDGPEAELLADVALEYGVQDSVTFAGYRGDARRLVQCLDMFVLTSWSEGISMSLLEAMASGVCVAVTHVGGNPDIIRTDIDGWLVPPGDAESLARRISEAAKDARRNAKFGLAAKRRFEEAFSFDHMFAAYERMYSDMLQR